MPLCDFGGNAGMHTNMASIFTLCFKNSCRFAELSTGINRGACASGDEHTTLEPRLEGWEFDIRPGLA